MKLVKSNNVGNYFNKLSDYIAFQYPTNYFINLLRTNDQFGQIAALKCLDKLPSEVLRKYINDICDFASRIDDEATNDLCIELIEKADLSLKDFFDKLFEALDNDMTEMFTVMSMHEMTINKEFGKIAIPYLTKVTHHQNVPSILKRHCLKVIEELRFD